MFWCAIPITKTIKPWQSTTSHHVTKKNLTPFSSFFPFRYLYPLIWSSLSLLLFLQTLPPLKKLQTVLHLCGMSTDSFQNVHVPLLLGGLKLYTPFQAWPYQGWEERIFIPLLPVILPQCSPWCSWWSCCEGVLQDYGQSVVYKDPEVLLWQDIAFSLSELHESISPTL